MRSESSCREAHEGSEQQQQPMTQFKPVNSLDPPPPAFLGYKFSKGGSLMICVCKWCASAPQVEAWAARHKAQVTHGICQAHYAEQSAKYIGEKTNGTQPTEEN